MAWLGQAGWLANAGLLKAVPGLRPDAQFFGHPPGLHFAAAVLFKVFGHSIEVAHVLIACLGAAGVGATYALVRGYDARTALLAALLLLFSPAWFSPPASSSRTCRSPRWACSAPCSSFAAGVLAYVVAASCMVLIKETAVALVVALIAFRVLTRLAAEPRRAEGCAAVCGATSGIRGIHHRAEEPPPAILLHL